MNDIRRRGGLIAIDDASTGYAGLLRLSTLRPDFVKLDRGLVTGARDNDVQAVVIEALVSLARRIGARTLGEGVETMDDLTVLAELDVDYAQGWAIGRPAPQLRTELPEIEAACRRARRNLMDVSAGFDDDLRGTAAITAALAGSTEPADVRAALAAASAELGVDVVGLSTLTSDGVLREITAAGADVDPREYQVADYPATQAALRARHDGRGARQRPALRPGRARPARARRVRQPAGHAGDRRGRAARHPRVQQLHPPPLDPARHRAGPHRGRAPGRHAAPAGSLSQTARRLAG